MTKRSRRHSSEEFGKQGSGLAGLDAPMIGAAGAIFSDALTERESGVTPQRPIISVRALAITFVVMFVLGLGGLWLMTRPHPESAEDYEPAYKFSYSREGTGTISGAFASRGAGAFQIGGGAPPVDAKLRPMRPPQLTYDSSTVFFINGQPFSPTGAGTQALTVYDVNGWPVTVEYVRVAGAEYPRATLVEFLVPESQVKEAIEAH